MMLDVVGSVAPTLGCSSPAVERLDTLSHCMHPQPWHAYAEHHPPAGRRLPGCHTSRQRCAQGLAWLGCALLVCIMTRWLRVPCQTECAAPLPRCTLLRAAIGLTYELVGHPDGWETAQRKRIVIRGAGDPVSGQSGTATDTLQGRRGGLAPPNTVSRERLLAPIAVPCCIMKECFTTRPAARTFGPPQRRFKLTGYLDNVVYRLAASARTAAGLGPESVPRIAFYECGDGYTDTGSGCVRKVGASLGRCGTCRWTVRCARDSAPPHGTFMYRHMPRKCLLQLVQCPSITNCKVYSNVDCSCTECNAGEEQPCSLDVPVAEHLSCSTLLLFHLLQLELAPTGNYKCNGQCIPDATCCTVAGALCPSANSNCKCTAGNSRCPRNGGTCQCKSGRADNAHTLFYRLPIQSSRQCVAAARIMVSRTSSLDETNAADRQPYNCCACPVLPSQAMTTAMPTTRTARPT